MVPAGSGDVPVLLDVGIEVAGVPELAIALDLLLRRSPAVDGHVLHRGTFDGHSASAGVHPNFRVSRAAAVTSFHSGAAPIGLAMAEVVAASVAAVAVAISVTAVSVAEAVRVVVLDAGAWTRGQMRWLQRIAPAIVHPLAGDAEFGAFDPERSSLLGDPLPHVSEGVSGESSQVSVVPAVAEGLWDSFVGGAVGPFSPVDVPLPRGIGQREQRRWKDLRGFVLPDFLRGRRRRSIEVSPLRACESVAR